MIWHMQTGNLAPATPQQYRRTVRSPARHIRNAPDQFDAEEILTRVVGVIGWSRAPSSTNATFATLRFFYRNMLDRTDIVRSLRIWCPQFWRGMPTPRKSKLPKRGISRVPALVS